MPVLKCDRILATTDFSRFANTTIGYAHALAEKFDAELHVLHVVRSLTEAVAEHGAAGVFSPDSGEDARANWLADLLGEAGQVRRIEAVRVGDNIAEKITEYAKENDIDLIVMATHGRTGLTHLWMGSVTEKVLRSTPCPVLVMRPDSK